MCGIVGHLDRFKSEHKTSFINVRTLSHRGPDSQGIWADELITLGHTRLSILDLSSFGHQPMMSDSERFCISFNGEIYNYLEIRRELEGHGFTLKSRGDTEVLLLAFEFWGFQCITKLRGMFAFAIWDRQTQSLFLARDRFGEKPLFYWHDEQRFYFASELKALLPMLPQVPELDPTAVDLYFHYQYVPEPLTPIKNVHKLPAAHYLNISLKEWSCTPQCYWAIEDIPPIEGNPVQLIRQELETSMDLVLRSDVPVGLALSGGIDSSAIAVLAYRQYPNTLQAFSIGYEGRPEYDERLQAQTLAQSLNLPFQDVELSTQGLIDFFPEFIAAYAAEHDFNALATS